MNNYQTYVLMCYDKYDAGQRFCPRLLEKDHYQVQYAFTWLFC